MAHNDGCIYGISSQHPGQDFLEKKFNSQNYPILESEDDPSPLFTNSFKNDLEEEEPVQKEFEEYPAPFQEETIIQEEERKSVFQMEPMQEIFMERSEEDSSYNRKEEEECNEEDEDEGVSLDPYSRKEKSLGKLCCKFLQKCGRTPESFVNLDLMTSEMGISSTIR